MLAYTKRNASFINCNDRRVLDANIASRLLLHLSLDDLRRKRVDDLIEPREALRLPGLWERLLERGEMLGIHELSAGTKSGLRIVVVAVANVLPGEHLLVLAPADGRGVTQSEQYSRSNSRWSGLASAP